MIKTISLSLICCNDIDNIEESMSRIKEISHLFKDIVVVDGNSSDGTTDYISKVCPEIEIIKVNYQHRLAQRIKSFENTTGDLVLIMDIDDMVDKIAINTNIKYLNQKNLSGVQFQLRSYELKSLSHRCWDSLMLSLYKPKSIVKTLGRPSITKRDYLKGITVPPKFLDIGEDTYISVRQEELFKELNFHIGDGVAFKKTEISLLKSFYKYFIYGFGDAYIVSQKPHKISNFLFHQLVNYSIIYTLKSFFRFKFLEGCIISLWGISRFIGMIIRLLDLFIKKVKNYFL